MGLCLSRSSDHSGQGDAGGSTASQPEPPPVVPQGSGGISVPTTEEYKPQTGAVDDHDAASDDAASDAAASDAAANAAASDAASDAAANAATEDAATEDASGAVDDPLAEFQNVGRSNPLRRVRSSPDVVQVNRRVQNRRINVDDGAAAGEIR